MVRLFRADLPPDTPGMIISDGTDIAVLVNAALAEERGPEWARGVANTLLAHSATEDGRLRAVG